jgi:hypothetical protein
MEKLRRINVAHDEYGYRCNRDEDLCVREMLLIWLDSSPSWEDLATALEQGSVGHSDMAKDIREKFNITEVPSDSCEYNG